MVIWIFRSWCGGGSCCRFLCCCSGCCSCRFLGCCSCGCSCCSSRCGCSCSFPFTFTRRSIDEGLSRVATFVREVFCFPLDGVINYITFFLSFSQLSSVLQVHWPVPVVTKVDSETSDLTCSVLSIYSFLREVVSWVKFCKLLFAFDSFRLSCVTYSTKASFYQYLSVSKLICDNHLVQFILTGVQDNFPFDTFWILWVLISILVLILTNRSRIWLVSQIISLLTILECLFTRLSYSTSIYNHIVFQ